MANYNEVEQFVDLEEVFYKMAEDDRSEFITDMVGEMHSQDQCGILMEMVQNNLDREDTKEFVTQLLDDMDADDKADVVWDAIDGMSEYDKMQLKERLGEDW